MTVEQLTAEARQLARDAFAERHPYLFFLFYEERGELSAVQFETQMARPRPTMPTDGALHVLPLAKAAGHPYADRISIGRARNCDVVLRHSSVSKLHAHVRAEAGRWLLYDAESHNGTSVGTKRVTGEAAELRSGDLVTFGGVTVRCVDAGELYGVLERLMAIQRG